MEAMAHKNSWFTVLKDGDFPSLAMFFRVPEGKLIFANIDQ